MRVALRVLAWIAVALVAAQWFRGHLEAYRADPLVQAAEVFVTRHPDLREALGGEVVVGGFPLGKTGEAGGREITLRVSGPAGSARVDMEMFRADYAYRVVEASWDGGTLGSGALEADDLLRIREGMDHGSRAHALRQLKRLEEALPEAERAVEIDPESPWNQYILGLILYSLKDYERALLAFERAVDLGPPAAIAASVHYRLGRALRVNRRPDEALEWLDRAIAAAPEMGSYVFQRGRVWEDRGDPERARADFRAACDLGWEEGCTVVPRGERR